MFIDDILLYNMLYIHDFWIYLIVMIYKLKKVSKNPLQKEKAN